MKCTPIFQSPSKPSPRKSNEDLGISNEELLLNSSRLDDDLKNFVFDLQRFDGEKTEEPTSKKREDARKKGQVAKSQELNTAFVLLIGFLILRIL